MTPVLCGLIAAVGWGGSDLIGRITARRLGPAGAMWGLSVSGFVVAGAMLFWFPLQWPHGDGWFWLIAAALVATMAPILFYRGLTLGPMALAAPLSAAYPVWVVAIAFAQGFRPSGAAWAAMGLVAAGGVVVGRTAPADPDETLAADPRNRRRAILVSLLTSVAFAGTIVTGGRSAARVGSLTTVWAARLAGVVLIGVTRPWRAPGFRSLRLWGVLLVQALFDNAAFAGIYLGSRGQGAAIAAVASSGFMVVSILLAALFLKEKLNLPCAIGAGAVFAGIAFLATFSP